MSNILRYCFLFFLVLIFSTASVLASEPKLAVKGTFHQGSILFAEIHNAPDNSSITGLFRGKKFTMEYDRGVYCATIPIALDCPAGAYKMSVEIETNGEKIKLERLIKTSEHTYGKQQLWLSDSQLATYDDPQADKDNDDILKALGFETDDIVWTNQFIRPLDGRISTLFGLKRFYNDDPEPEFHKGVDIASYVGAKVVAPQNGIVRMAKENLVLHGGTVVIDHGRGVGTIYLHLDSVSVSEGDSVKQGDEIGRVGDKGVSTAPHLHWAAYSHGVPISPWQLFSLPASWLK